VSHGRVQLIALSCIFVASKYEEIYYPTLADLEWLSSKTIGGKDIVKAESIILATLHFDLTTINPFHFIRRFSKVPRRFCSLGKIINYQLSIIVDFLTNARRRIRHAALTPSPST
jgi:hypothetical protein